MWAIERNLMKMVWDMEKETIIIKYSMCALSVSLSSLEVLEQLTLFAWLYVLHRVPFFVDMNL